MSSSVQLEQRPEQIELPTIMVPESPLEDDERLLSQTENDKSVEASSKYAMTLKRVRLLRLVYSAQQRNLLRLGLSFFLFGLINNGAYVRVLMFVLINILF